MVSSRNIVVPTDDKIVRKLIRELDKPMCYFAEGPQERRERLAVYLSELTPEERAKLLQKPEIVKPEVDNQRFYYEGSGTLKTARYKICEHSIRHCSERLDMARIKTLEPLSTRLIGKQELIESVRNIEDLGSYLDEDSSATELKTLTSSNLNYDSSLLASSCRSGKCKIWSIPDMSEHSSLKGHTICANFIIFSPKSGSTIPHNAANLASCSMDGSILLWNLVDGNPICSLSSGDVRISRIRYHPSGDYLGSCCSNNSWRLWDLASETEILHQEGHSEPVFDIGFHVDGSLAVSAGLDCYAKTWDLRTGKLIHSFEGHSSGLRSVDLSPDGYHVATGGLDNSVKIWNLRQRRLEYTIPAHLKAVTTVMFEKNDGHFLVTSSFDQTVKFWSSQTWSPVKTLDAYDDKITNLDLSQDNKYIASCYSKSIRIWTIK